MKCIAFDLDGTILNSDGRVSQKTVSVLHKASDAGIVLVCCTGRDYGAAKSAISPLGLEKRHAYFCGMNGQCIHSFQDQKIIEKDVLKEDEVVHLGNFIRNRFCLAIVQKENQMTVVYGEKKKWIADIYVKVSRFFWFYRQNDSYNQIEGVSIQNFKGERYAKVCFTGLPWTLNQIKKQIGQREPNKYACSMVASFWMECQTSDISKAEALKIIAEKENYSMEDIIAFGDGENDISMLQVAGKGIAMKNAMRNVKKHADDICDSNKNDGVAKYIELLLKMI